jgi:hypothetical protein
MKEELMNDTEEAARRLFTVATEDIPPEIDLLCGVRARNRKRAVRVRAGVAAAAAGIVAAAAAIMLSAGPAPSAFAQVMRAATRTAAASYQVRSEEKIVRIGGLRSKPWATAYGEFDPALGVGEETDDQGLQIRYVGGYSYLFVTDDIRADPGGGSGPIPAWASWERLPGGLDQGGRINAAGLGLLGAFPGFLAQVNPQDLLALLRSATDVRQAGPASGPGWTGSAYTFTIAATLNGPLHTPAGLSGMVDVDQQGQVRELDARATFATTVSQVKITFSAFGLPVSVSAPPTSQTYIPPGS